MCEGGGIRVCLGDKKQPVLFGYAAGGKHPCVEVSVQDSIVISVHPICLFVAIELQVKADPHFPCGNLVQQQTTCYRSLVFQLFLDGCHRNLCPTQKVC